jgi:hypothetical protein
LQFHEKQNFSTASLRLPSLSLRSLAIDSIRPRHCNISLANFSSTDADNDALYRSILFQ